MRLTILGCAGSFPGPEAACSSYLVEADGFRLLVDFGTGSLSALQRHGVMNSIDAILISHLHGDHMFDACMYVVVRRYGPEGPYPALPLYGPAGTRDRVATAYGLNEGPLDDVYTFHELATGTLAIGPFTVTVARVNHPVETYGFRIEHDGRVLTYSADTATCGALDDLAKGADLFLCEASYLDGDDNPPGLHLTGREAAEVATKAGATRLVLTHLVAAWTDEAKVYQAAVAAFAGPVDIARAGVSYDL
jgi:ribonuclease BN (tRNA processing enzyme)